jgi:hypothetical protein
VDTGGLQGLVDDLLAKRVQQPQTFLDEVEQHPRREFDGPVLKTARIAR